MTKGYFLAMIMLAMAAAGVVWIAIKERPNATTTTATVASASSTPVSMPVSTPTPPPTPPPTPTPIEDADIGDGGPTADASDASASDAMPSTQTFPPLAANAAWSVVRWDMSVAEAEAALKKEGVVAVEEIDSKTGAKRLRAKTGASDATIDFGAKNANEIVVTVTDLSKEGARAVVAKTNERAPATKTSERTERRWKKDTGALASLITYVDGTTAKVHEEHARERSPGGGIGFAGLRWGMSTQEVVGQLTAAGYAAHVEKASAAGLGPCALPNPSPDCAKKSQAATVPFIKGDVEGTASFNQFGLRQVELTGPTTDSGATRAKELESSLGKPASVEVSTKTEHVDHGRMTSIEIEVRERPPGVGLTVVETYRPKR